MSSDTVLILFGGSGSEIEVCKVLNRHFIAAEIDEQYYNLINDRLNKGRIEEKYRLRMNQYQKTDAVGQLVLLEGKEEYKTS